MNIPQELQGIMSEPDLASKALKLSMLIATLFREIGYEMVVVGGSAIEFYTNGDYMSGDVDMCFLQRRRPELRKVAEIMAQLGATGGPRSFKVAGLFIDVLGEVESFARTPCRKVQNSDGSQYILLIQPEDLLAERMLMALYPAEDEPALACTKKLVQAGLRGDVEIDWDDALRVAALPEYRVEKELASLIEQMKNSAQP